MKKKKLFCNLTSANYLLSTFKKSMKNRIFFSFVFIFLYFFLYSIAFSQVKTTSSKYAVILKNVSSSHEAIVFSQQVLSKTKEKPQILKTDRGFDVICSVTPNLLEINKKISNIVKVFPESKVEKINPKNIISNNNSFFKKNNAISKSKVKKNKNNLIKGVLVKKPIPSNAFLPEFTEAIDLIESVSYDSQAYAILLSCNQTLEKALEYKKKSLLIMQKGIQILKKDGSYCVIYDASNSYSTVKQRLKDLRERNRFAWAELISFNKGNIIEPSLSKMQKPESTFLDFKPIGSISEGFSKFYAILLSSCDSLKKAKEYKNMSLRVMQPDIQFLKNDDMYYVICYASTDHNDVKNRFNNLRLRNRFAWTELIVFCPDKLLAQHTKALLAKKNEKPKKKPIELASKFEIKDTNLQNAALNAITAVSFSKEHVNRIVCINSKVKDVSISNEKGFIKKIEGKNIFLKYKDKSYNIITSSELYVTCEPDKVFTLYAYPYNLSGQTIVLKEIAN